MKKWLSIVLSLCLLFSFGGCSGKEQAAGETGEPTAAPEVIRGSLFLTVSQITFSVISESEDIYAGSVPRDLVSWESRDPHIIEVHNGVLTAVGVGETEVTASWGGQKLTCKAACLAENQQELLKLARAVLQAPKRIPPATEDSCKAYFENSAMVGDSITYALLHWEQATGNLGHPQFLCRGGISIFSLLDRGKLLYFRGQDTLLEDAVAASNLNAVFILLGQNDLGYMEVDETLRNMGKLMERVREKSPLVEIYLQSCLPVRGEDALHNNGNEKLAAFNGVLKPFAQAKGYHYLNTAQYLENQIGSMAAEYCLDEIHPNEAGCLAWMAGLRACLYAEQLQYERS